MTVKNIIKREIYVALHAQSTKFRIKKYIVLTVLLAGAYLAYGLMPTLWLLALLTVLALAVHFFFRYKTRAWTASWGPYKKIPLPEEGD